MLLDYDQFTGMKQTFHKDPMTGKVTIKTEQDTQGTIDAIARRKDASQSWKGDMHHVASIPLIIIEQWREELKAKGVSNPDPLAKENHTFLIAKINSSEFSKLRLKEGRI